jgi:uncharacterized membrane protein YecN with MAPEG domain
MLHISGLYSALLTILVIVLTFAVIRQRQKLHVGLGDGGHESLTRAMRAHGNAIETIPLSLLLLIILEVNQASATSLHIFGSLLFIGRLLHAWGLSQKSGTSFGRFYGMVITLLVQTALVMANLWLFWAAIK